MNNLKKSRIHLQSRSYFAIMHLVWWLFKIIEALMGYTCLIVHIINVRGESAISHVVIYCGTFFGFAMMASFQAAVIILNRGTNPINECIINVAGTLMYTVAALLSLWHLQGDYRVMYLSDFEEAEHRFFVECVLLSTLAITTGLLYLLHCILAFDTVLVKHSDNLDQYEGPQPLKLYFICPSIHEKLEHYSWFQQFQTTGHPRNFRTSLYQNRQTFESENFGDRARLKMTISRLSCKPEKRNYQRKSERRTRSYGGLEGNLEEVGEDNIEDAATAIPLRDIY
uniref:DUF7775 domain-containing protein n=1 Tax=Glossina pallidipes TaxID=7398 RepID=A0A1B0ACC3_GLOPL